jgi:hypothetical protein
MRVCAAECDAWVDLELAEYAAIRADPDRMILSLGHVAPSPAQRGVCQIKGVSPVVYFASW